MNYKSPLKGNLIAIYKYVRGDGKSGVAYITFGEDMRNIINKMGLTHCMIGQDDITGEIGMLLSKDVGVPLTKYGTSIRLANKPWIDRMITVFGLDKDKTINQILIPSNNLAKRDDVLFYRLRMPPY